LIPGKLIEQVGRLEPIRAVDITDASAPRREEFFTFAHPTQSTLKAAWFMP
jgi:hypothetical protein